jgi:23S rRNA (cytidine1920-2'-O)/16S rRNA (cytidine1409-2'-O)-methyltransferase
VLAGRVSVEGAPAAKAGHLYRADAAVAVTAVSPYVGRGGEKLAGALDAFSVDPGGRVCLDVGASTGGFTDCLLTRGARRVYAVDVGHGQLHPRLRSDPRVVVSEGVNARALEAAQFDPRPDLATVDVSFISLEKVLPAVAACLAPGPGDLVVLAKPQFEVGRGRVGKGGVVRDAARHAEVLRRLAAFAAGAGLALRAVAASPLRGAKGNREFFLHLQTAGEPLAPAQVAAAIEAAVAGTERAAASDSPGPGERRGDRRAGQPGEGAPVSPRAVESL